MEGHAQAPAFAALGRYFEEVERKPEQAMRCYKRALALDPSVAVAGASSGGGGGGAGGAGGVTPGSPAHRPSWVNNLVGAVEEAQAHALHAQQARQAQQAQQGARPGSPSGEGGTPPKAGGAGVRAEDSAAAGGERLAGSRAVAA